MERVSLDDRRVIERQLGREPRGAFSVAVRCPHGHPQVLRVAPLVDGRPFPTLYWLSCPFLGRAVGSLESQGWVGRLERRVADDPELRLALSRAHEEYIAAREELLTPELRRTSAVAGQIGGLVGRGIGGISDRRRLKCLHVHVAHALAGTNPVGEIVLEMLSARACSPKDAICSSLVGERSRSQINR